MGKLEKGALRAVIVLLAGLTCDSQCYPRGRVEEPGPELLEYAKGKPHWTGARAARFADEGPLEVDAASPQGEALPPGVYAPPGSVVVLYEGLTADNRVWHLHEVCRRPGPELLAYCEPGVLHWASHKPAARLVPRTEGPELNDLVAQSKASMVEPDFEERLLAALRESEKALMATLPEKAARVMSALVDLSQGVTMDQLRERYAFTQGEAKMLGLDTLEQSSAPLSPEQAPDSGQEAPAAPEAEAQGQPGDAGQEDPQEPSGEATEVKDQF